MKLPLLVALSFLSACQAQTDVPLTDCIQLGFPAGAPFTGGDNALCGDLGSNQCCSPTFLSMTAEMAAERAFKQALRDELDDSDEDYGLVNTNLTQFFTDSFITRMAMSFPFVGSLDPSTITQFASELSQDLIPNLNIDTSAAFNPQMYIDTALSGLSGFAASFISQNDSSQSSCVQNILSTGLNDRVKQLLANSIQTVRQSLTSLGRIQTFLTMQRQQIVNSFTPVRGCVERLARQSFCGRCTRRIPPLCRGTCNALVRGCLSPVYSAFQRDFRQLWNVSRAIITNMERTIRNQFIEQTQIIDIPTTYLSIRSQCGLNDFPTIPPITLPPGFTLPTLPGDFTPPPGFTLPGGFTPPSGFTFPSGIGKRQSDSDDDNDDDEERRVFNGVRERLDNFDGLFDYDSDGPEFCEPSSDEEDFCEAGRNLQGRGCVVSEICTSACRCWDGNQMRDTDAPDFTRNGVNEQADNPAVDGLEDELVAQANELGTSTPANVFLSSSEFMEVLPQGIEIPEAEPFTGGTSTGGAVRVVVSLIVMAIAALVGLTL